MLVRIEATELLGGGLADEGSKVQVLLTAADEGGYRAETVLQPALRSPSGHLCIHRFISRRARGRYGKERFAVDGSGQSSIRGATYAPPGLAADVLLIDGLALVRG